MGKVETTDPRAFAAMKSALEYSKLCQTPGRVSQNSFDLVFLGYYFPDEDHDALVARARLLRRTHSSSLRLYGEDYILGAEKDLPLPSGRPPKYIEPAMLERLRTNEARRPSRNDYSRKFLTEVLGNAAPAIPSTLDGLQARRDELVRELAAIDIAIAAETQSAVMATASPVLTEDHLDRYLLDLATNRRLSSSTIRGVRDELKLLVCNDVPLNAETIERFIARQESRTGKPPAPATRRRRLTFVRGLCRWLTTTGVLTADPTTGIIRPRGSSTTTPTLSTTDLQRLLTVMDTEPASPRRFEDTCILLLFFYTGLRVSDLARLDVEQVDLDALLLRRANHKNRSESDVVLHPRLAQVLDTWLGVRGPSKGALFPARPTRAGTTSVATPMPPMTVRAIQLRLRNLGERAGLSESLRPMALRRGLASALIHEGINHFPWIESLPLPSENRSGG